MATSSEVAEASGRKVRTVQSAAHRGLVPGAKQDENGNWVFPDLQAAVDAVTHLPSRGRVWAGVTKEERVRRERLRYVVLSDLCSGRSASCILNDITDNVREMCGWKP